MFKVRDSDNVFLTHMRCISMVERDDKSNKIIKAYYKAWCTICIFTVTAKSEITAKKAIIAHIISHHRDVWINHEPDLVKE